jgi:hypothetical protein
MLVQNNAYGYSRRKKYVTGRGFVDSVSNIFNAMKASAFPAIKNFGSYVANNKDLIAKPLLGAVGQLAATGLTAGVPALLSHIMKRKQVDPKYEEILQNLVPPSARAITADAAPMLKAPNQPPVTNIIGSGRRGAGIKKF